MLRALKAAGKATAILSNGTPDMLEGAVAAAGIGDVLDACLSVQSVGVFKPARAVYGLVGEYFGCACGRGAVRLVELLGRLRRRGLRVPRRLGEQGRRADGPAALAPGAHRARPDHDPGACRMTDVPMMTDAVTIDDIRAAARRLEGQARVTPLLESPFLNEAAGRRVLVKAECLQRTGSFKFRGGWSAVSALPEAVRRRGVIAYSSGNHAQGVAHAAELMGVPCVILMPNDAPKLKIANTRAHGAEVVLYDRPGGESREEIGAAIAGERGLTLIKPYDEPMVIAGQGTCGLEIAEQARAAGVAAAPTCWSAAAVAG